MLQVQSGYFGVRIIRILQFRVLYQGPPFWETPMFPPRKHRRRFAQKHRVWFILLLKTSPVHSGESARYILVIDYVSSQDLRS